MAEKAPLRGLENWVGQHNCFLNVVIQSLWHSSAFRSIFSSDKEVVHTHELGASSCVVCALNLVCMQYAHSNRDVLPPTALRIAMSEMYASQNRFQMNRMDDADEAMMEILRCIHTVLGTSEFDQNRFQQFESNKECKTLSPKSAQVENGENGENVGEESIFTKSKLDLASHSKLCECPAHNVFGLATSTSYICKSCTHVLSLPVSLHEYGFRTYVMGLISCQDKLYDGDSFLQIMGPNSTHSQTSRASFGTWVKRADHLSTRECPECGSLVEPETFCMNAPEELMIGVVWPSDCVEKQTIGWFLEKLEPELKLKDMFDVCVLENNAGTDLDFVDLQEQVYKLSGFICFYGKHYVAFHHDGDCGQWFVFDDAAIRPVGTDWASVTERCEKGRFQPSLLFFTKCVL